MCGCDCLSALSASIGLCCGSFCCVSASLVRFACLAYPFFDQSVRLSLRVGHPKVPDGVLGFVGEGFGFGDEGSGSHYKGPGA